MAKERRQRESAPHRSRWALDEYAERSTVVADTADGFTAEVDLLEPVGWPVGLITLAAWPAAGVLSPSGLVSEAPTRAERPWDRRRSGARQW
ncbi:hypothetical protein GCM10028801_28580 [Nocardioides maradonensis]